jgi:hypothetical protein
MTNVLDKNCGENQTTHFMLKNSPPPPENRSVYETMSKNLVEVEAKNDVTIWRILVACWISKTTVTHAHAYAHVPEHPHASTHARARTHTNTRRQTCITYCFFTEKMIRQRASVLRYTFIACLFLLLATILLALASTVKPLITDTLINGHHQKRTKILFPESPP